jgi:hypothetical protein
MRKIWKQNGQASSPVVLIKSKAQEIYVALKVKKGDISSLFSDPDTNFNMSHIKLVSKETLRLESEINLYMSGRKVIAEAVLDEDGIEITPIEYYSPSTKPNLNSKIDSDYLNTNTCITDMMDGDTFGAFKTSYIEAE